MKICVYEKSGTAGIVLAILSQNGSDVPEITGYNKYIVDATAIEDLLEQPVDVRTFLANYDVFHYESSPSRLVQGSIGNNRRITNLSEDTAMSIGRANTTTLFNSL